jgi:hypothetical protein
MLIGITFILLIPTFIFLVGIFLFILVIPVQAEVVINEVYPNPLSGESEWIELFNDSTASTSLEGWVLEDKLSSSKVIYSLDNVTLLTDDYYFQDN